jgi:RNA binding exosome subunit
MLTTQIKKNKKIVAFLEKLQPHHPTILAELDKRMDENNVIHLRFSLESMIGQQVEMIQSEIGAPTIKVRIKLAVYPGQEVESIATDIFG